MVILFSVYGLFSSMWCNFGCKFAVIIEQGQLTRSHDSSRIRSHRFCPSSDPSPLIFMVRYLVLFLVLVLVLVSSMPDPLMSRFSIRRPCS